MPHFSALTWRILGFNALALIVLTAGVILVQASGRGLVEERLNSIQEQANIVGGTLAEYATDPETHTLKVTEAEPLLRQLIAPTRLRGRLYLPGGQLAIDTSDLLARNVVQMGQLPSLDTTSQVKEWLRRVYDGVMGVRPFAQLEPYYEAGDDGRVYREVDTALAGQIERGEQHHQECHQKDLDQSESLGPQDVVDVAAFGGQKQHAVDGAKALDRHRHRQHQPVAVVHPFCRGGLAP